MSRESSKAEKELSGIVKNQIVVQLTRLMGMRFEQKTECAGKILELIDQYAKDPEFQITLFQHLIENFNCVPDIKDTEHGELMHNHVHMQLSSELLKPVDDQIAIMLEANLTPIETAKSVMSFVNSFDGIKRTYVLSVLINCLEFCPYFQIDQSQTSLSAEEFDEILKKNQKDLIIIHSIKNGSRINKKSDVARLILDIINRHHDPRVKSALLAQALFDTKDHVIHVLSQASPLLSLLSSIRRREDQE